MGARRFRTTLTFVATAWLVVPLLGSGLARAGGSAHLDGNDTINDLDVHVSRLVVNHDNRRVSIRIRWYDEVDSHLASGKYFIFVDSRGGSRWDLKVKVSNPRFFGPFCTVLRSSGRTSECKWKEAPDYLSHRVWFRQRLLRRTKPIRFRVVTKRQRGRIVDLAPNVGWYVD